MEQGLCLKVKTRRGGTAAVVPSCTWSPRDERASSGEVLCRAFSDPHEHMEFPSSKLSPEPGSHHLLCCREARVAGDISVWRQDSRAAARTPAIHTTGDKLSGAPGPAASRPKCHQRVDQRQVPTVWVHAHRM